MLTGKTCRGLRARLDWSERKLADRSGVSFADIVVFERLGHIDPEHKTMLEQAFKASGADVDADPPQGARQKREQP